MTAFAAAMAAVQASLLVTATPAQVLYAVALTPVFLLKTPALTYRLARIAFAADLVTRPYSDAGRVAGRSTAAAISSDSMNWKSSVRVELGYFLSSVVVTSGGAPPKKSCSM